jgi:hypothetical protein
MQFINRLRSPFFRLILMTLAAVYLLFSVGVMKATHFCMGREASTTFFSAESEECPCSIFVKENGEGETDGCCDNAHEVIRLKDDHKVMTAYTIRVPQLYILEDLYTERFIASLLIEDQSGRDPEPDAAPPKIPLFKTNCSFVFYDSEISA